MVDVQPNPLTLPEGKSHTWDREQWERAACYWEEECDRFRDASGLVGGCGDPSCVTPEQLEGYIDQMQSVMELVRRVLDPDHPLFSGHIGAESPNHISYSSGNQPRYFALLDAANLDQLRAALDALPQDV